MTLKLSSLPVSFINMEAVAPYYKKLTVCYFTTYCHLHVTLVLE